MTRNSNEMDISHNNSWIVIIEILYVVLLYFVIGYYHWSREPKHEINSVRKTKNVLSSICNNIWNILRNKT